MGALHQAWAPCPAGEDPRQPGQAHHTTERLPYKATSDRKPAQPAISTEAADDRASNFLPDRQSPAACQQAACIVKTREAAWPTADRLQERLCSSTATRACTCMALLGAYLGRGLS